MVIGCLEVFRGVYRVFSCTNYVSDVMVYRVETFCIQASSTRPMQLSKSFRYVIGCLEVFIECLEVFRAGYSVFRVCIEVFICV